MLFIIMLKYYSCRNIIYHNVKYYLYYNIKTNESEYIYYWFHELTFVAGYFNSFMTGVLNFSDQIELFPLIIISYFIYFRHDNDIQTLIFKNITRWPFCDSNNFFLNI